MKISELPEGSVIELSNGDRFELSSRWESREYPNTFAKDELDLFGDVKIISVPYGVTLKLASYLAGVTFESDGSISAAPLEACESFILEAANDLKKGS